MSEQTIIITGKNTDATNIIIKKEAEKILRQQRDRVIIRLERETGVMFVLGKVADYIGYQLLDALSQEGLPIDTPINTYSVSADISVFLDFIRIIKDTALDPYPVIVSVTKRSIETKRYFVSKNFVADLTEIYVVELAKRRKYKILNDKGIITLTPTTV